MRITEKIVEQTAALIIFMMSMVLMASLFRSLYQQYNSTEKNIMSGGIYAQGSPDTAGQGDINIVTEKEIIALVITEKLDYDLMVDGMEIKKEGFYPYLFDLSSIHRGTYKKQYERNPDGTIKKLVYRRLDSE